MPTPSPIAIQRPLLSVEQTRALVSLEVVKTELVDYTEDQILTFAFAMSNGLPMLGPVWNIATANAKRAERRVLMVCVRAFKGGRVLAVKPAEAMDLILGKPTVRTWLTGTELQRRLNCSSGHIMNLLAEQAITALKNDWRPGRGGSPAITRDSIIKFLTATQEI